MRELTCVVFDTPISLPPLSGLLAVQPGGPFASACLIGRAGINYRGKKEKRGKSRRAQGQRIILGKGETQNQKGQDKKTSCLFAFLPQLNIFSGFRRFFSFHCCSSSPCGFLLLLFSLLLLRREAEEGHAAVNPAGRGGPGGRGRSRRRGNGVFQKVKIPVHK